MAHDATPTEILQHAGALRNLARALVRDAAEADDALQETLLRALVRPPSQGPTTGAWLSTVMRNVVRNRWRKQARGASAGAKAPQRTGPREPPERLQQQERAHLVLSALRSLSLEQREVIELRFFEGLPPRVIAAQLGQPVETVKSRIKRALALLREALTAREGTSWPFAFALAPDMGAAAFLGKSVAANSAPSIATAVGSVFMQKSLLPLFGILLVLGLGIVVVLPQLTDHEGPPSTSEDASRTRATESRTASASAQLGGRAPTGTLATESELRARRDADHGAVTDKAQARGVVRLLDEAGEALEAPTGTLHVRMRRGASYSELAVDVKAGACTFVIPRGHLPEFEGLTLAERVARIQSPEPSQDTPLAEVYEVVARLIPPTRIRVLDGPTGKVIPAARVERPRTGGSVTVGDGALRPTPLEIHTVAEDLDALEVDYRVSAPGYAWTTVRVDPSAQREFVAELWPAGSLVLEIGPGEAVPGAQVRVRFRDSKTYSTAAVFPLAPGKVHTIDALRAGNYEVSIELGRWFKKVAVLGTASFAIRVAEETRTRVTYTPPERIEAVHVRGILHIPSGWALEDFVVSLECIEAPQPGPVQRPVHLHIGRGLTPTEADPREFRFDLGKVQPGRYLVEFWRQNLQTALQIPFEREPTIRLELPRRVRVRVQVDERALPKGTFVREINWHAEVPKGATRWTWSSVTRDHADQPFEFMAPATRIYVRTADYAYITKKILIDCTRRNPAGTLTVYPTHPLRITVHDGESVLPWNWDWAIRITSLSGTGTTGSSSLNEGHYIARVSEPGRYRIQIGTIPGFEPLDPIEVEIRAEAANALKVPLTRRR